MKTRTDLLCILMMFVCIGCQTKTAVTQMSTTEPEMRHQEAIKVLEEHKFIIEADELYLPTEKVAVVTSPGNYISLNGQQAVVNFTEDVFPRSPWTYLIINDKAAQITKVTTRKNGNIEYCIEIDGGQTWLKRTVLITLYANTNECFVQVKDRRTGQPVVDFKGRIYELKRDDRVS